MSPKNVTVVSSCLALLLLLAASVVLLSCAHRSFRGGRPGTAQVQVAVICIYSCTS